MKDLIYMNKKFLTLSTAAIAMAIALAGCGSGPGSGTTTTGTDSGSASATASAPSGSATAAAEHNAADTMFAQMMIPHHTQAVEMSDMMLAKKDIPAKVTALAQKIKAAQAPEIETMSGWLRSWNEPSEAASGHDMSTHGPAMGGMMSDDDMKKLGAAQGTEAAKLFLTQMTAHHQGAIMMAKGEKTGGQNADAVALAKAIAAAQQKEIQEMKDLLATL
ncbi:hypothetical protein ARGLB_064_00390 [Arthrobacter globiformis NBRC 12137]|uniref:DUF305 domain-containing protein n=2 Tax=Arthrobacter globiformis TaxID=1665 RepID=H0QN76_ARTG1|nr:hypothetical protein ARGLB_064_00390 [Arthrobacter globiformis NBRC 12137]